MKNKNYIIGGIAIFGLILLVVYAMGNSETAERFRWEANFDDQGNNPYDVSVFYQLMQQNYPITPLTTRVTESLATEPTAAKGSTYCFVGVEPIYTEAEAEHLLKYVENGGTAFIVCQKMPDTLAKFLFFAEDCGFALNFEGGRRRREEWSWDAHSENTVANFTHPKLRTKEGYDFAFLSDANHWQQNRWSFFPIREICENTTYKISLLGTLQFDNKEHNFDNRGNPLEETQANFFRLQVGAGYFYFHTTPYLFSNFFLRDDAAFEYTNKVLAHFPTNQKTFWDTQSKFMPRIKRKDTQQFKKKIERNPMDYIYSQASLQAGWYMLLGGSLLYMMFRAKRRQRVIPILETNRNTSLEFVQTVGLLYYQQQNHSVIYNKLMQHFRGHLRQRYQILSKDGQFDKEFVARVCYRTAVPTEIVQPIFDKFAAAYNPDKRRATNIGVEKLHDFYQTLERFHQYEQQNKFSQLAS
jgi:hypothetical protein